MSLYEKLTPSAKYRLKAAAEKYQNIIDTIETDLKNNESYYFLKYETVYNLSITGVINGCRPNDIKQLFEN